MSISIGLCVVSLQAAPQKDDKVALLKCSCNCKICPPNSTLVKSHKHPDQYRKCFRDSNKDSICDNSVLAKRKCKNNCTAIKPDSAKESNKKVQSPCESCPCKANCSKCMPNLKNSNT